MTIHFIRLRKCVNPAIALIAGAALALTNYVPAQGAAPPPVSLVLGGGGGTVWNFANIKPGDSGNKIVSLKNVGTTDGKITIWMSHIVDNRTTPVDPKFAGLTGGLSDYLRINAFSRGLEANIVLPITLKNFPQSSTSVDYVRVNPLRAGETIDLTWKWELPAQTGNEVQGKTTSFTINYLLEEIPQPPPPAGSEPEIPTPTFPPNIAPVNPAVPPAPTPPAEPEPPPPVTLPSPQPTPVTPPVNPIPVQPVTPEPVNPTAPQIPEVKPVSGTGVLLNVLMVNSQYTVKTDLNGLVQESAMLSNRANNFVIDVPEGTRITDQDGNILDNCVLTVVSQDISNFTTIPAGYVSVGPVYSLEGFRNGQKVTRIKFEPYVSISMSYDPKALPENVLTPFIINFSGGGAPARLNVPPGTLFETGKVRAAAYHASYFALMAEVLPPPSPLPPHFIVSNLKVTPAQAKAGQTVIVNVDVANDGDAAGNYELRMVIDGAVRAIRDINLQPNSLSTLTFEVTDLAPGVHHVRVAGLTGEFRIMEAAGITPVRSLDWAVLDFITAGIILFGILMALLVIKRQNRTDKEER